MPRLPTASREHHEEVIALRLVLQTQTGAVPAAQLECCSISLPRLPQKVIVSAQAFCHCAANCIQNCTSLPFGKALQLAKCRSGSSRASLAWTASLTPDDGGNVRFVPISDIGGHQPTSADIRRLRPCGPAWSYARLRNNHSHSPPIVRRRRAGQAKVRPLARTNALPFRHQRR